MVLLSVAFITLAERKIMGSMQRRIGPNNVSIYGIMQPLADGGKLFIKETIIPTHSNKNIFILTPIITLTFSLLGWLIIPYNKSTVILNELTDSSILYILAMSSLGIYGIIFSGWSANSKYSFIGSLRSTAQMISYEVILGILIISFVYFSIGYSPLNLNQIIFSQQSMSYCIPNIIGLIIWIIASLAETNRSPFDLPEAESELVAGYFTEHSSLPFAYFFLGEYSSILLISTITIILFCSGYYPLVGLIIYLFIWVRASFPRYRYNQLISICWTNLLPITLGNLILIPSIILTCS